MNNTLTFEVTAEEALQIQTAMVDCIAQITRQRENMRRMQTHIDEVGARTDARLVAIRSQLDMFEASLHA